MKANDIQKHIEQYGWHFVHVFDPEGNKPDFSYSVGFEASFEHPEIMTFGLEREAAHAILSSLADHLRQGGTYSTGRRLGGILGGDYDVMFKKVRPDAFDRYLGAAVRFYEQPFRAYVLLWPDKSNVLPIDADCAVSLQDEALSIIEQDG